MIRVNPDDIMSALYEAVGEGTAHVQAFMAQPGFDWTTWVQDSTRMVPLICNPLQAYRDGLDERAKAQLRVTLQYLLNVDASRSYQESTPIPGLQSKRGVVDQLFARYQDAVLPHDGYSLCLWMWSILFPGQLWHADISDWVVTDAFLLEAGSRGGALPVFDDPEPPGRIADDSTGLVDEGVPWSCARERFIAGMAHVETAVIRFEKLRYAESCLRAVEENACEAYACVLLLARHSLNRAMLAWFRDRDLQRFKQHAYEVAKLQRIAFHYQPDRRISDELYFAPLLCDNAELLSWFRQHDLMPRKDMFHRPSHSYRWWQTTHAMQGEWIVLGVSAKDALFRLQWDASADDSFVSDHLFFLALAKGDVEGMSNVLQCMTTPQVARERQERMEFLTTDFFLATHAVMYAKLAWSAGYQVDIDSPLVPREWLPIAPLKRYEDPYPFMQRFDIHQPLDRRPL